MVRAFRIARLLLYAGLIISGLVPLSHGSAGHGQSKGFLLHLDGVIDPNHAKYLKRGLDRAEEEGAHFTIIMINTPGGLVSSMRDMVENILASEIPVITFVGPQGARAGSAGTFITAAGHRAVMAPGTNIGAATPVAGGGEELPETLANKVTNDAAALIRSIAEQRGRNPDPLEDTVRKASSFTNNEALELNIIDFIANDLDDLLLQLDGMTIAVGEEEVTLDTQGVTCTEPYSQCTSVSLSFVERFLDVISDPNISAILVSIGGLGIFVEFLNPGLLFPGVFGAIMLVLAFVAAGNLPLNWAGAGLMLFAFVLLYLELQVSGVGVLGAGGLISFILGSLFLFAPWAADPPNISGPRVQVSPWLIGGLSGGFGLFLGTLTYLAWRGRRSPPTQPLRHQLIGQKGRVTVTLSPVGTVYAGYQPWTARSEHDQAIEAGEQVEIVDFDGLTMYVRKVAKLLPAGDPPEGLDLDSGEGGG